jgi:hypothetical protein
LESGSVEGGLDFAEFVKCSVDIEFVNSLIELEGTGTRVPQLMGTR